MRRTTLAVLTAVLAAVAVWWVFDAFPVLASFLGGTDPRSAAILQYSAVAGAFFFLLLIFWLAQPMRRRRRRRRHN